MGNLLQPDPRVVARTQKRLLNRSVRVIENDDAEMQRQEEILVRDITTAARLGRVAPMRTKARDLVRIRKHREQIASTIAQLRAVEIQISQLASVAAIGDAMKQATKAVTSLNGSLNPRKLAKITAQYMTETERAQLVQEQLEDTISVVADTGLGMIGDDSVEDETDQVIDQVLDDLGVALLVNPSGQGVPHLNPTDLRVPQSRGAGERVQVVVTSGHPHGDEEKQ